MRLPDLLASTPVLLVLPSAMMALTVGCTSDLPAPYNYEVLEPPPPDNELAVDCANLPITAEGAQYAQTPTITGQLEDVTYRYGSTELPAGLAIDESTGEISGVVGVEPGAYTFDVTIEDVDDPAGYNATGTCTLQVRPRLTAPLELSPPFCLRTGESLLDLVVDGTGDGTPITCDHRGGSGNGRKPDGIEVDPEACTLTGSITNRTPTADDPNPATHEDRHGTFVFTMRGMQSGVEVFVPYCVTNEVSQDYDILGTHSGIADATLDPISVLYDPAADYSVGVDGDPRYEITSPGVCGAVCNFNYKFSRTYAAGEPDVGLDTFSLSPDGLVRDAMMQPIGFFHELRLAGGPQTEQFRDRPWVLSVNVGYCFSDDEADCTDVTADGNVEFELGVIMVPDRG
ncbi:Ig domain-containing protein [Paraliomyxa miuraensis]|uniref:Ig domain-containing protein n=1 Tax=Paraliomyxa miuraensis TaxID=376150 RepID=UPI00225B08A7|nr:Ig domain-containing protein [Paraliomyxa miuraensis]MCX4246580.1 Ig domain-containing protein [Paraliomyxa miuraensis]